MYVGQHSWVAVVVLFGVMAVRIMASQRRRAGGRPGRPSGARGFTGTPVGREPSSTPETGTSSTGTAPGWFTDPFVRHEQRYWSGTAWTEHVQDRGTPSVDPPPPPRTPPA